jgi:hypothetical protein
MIVAPYGNVGTNVASAKTRYIGEMRHREASNPGGCAEVQIRHQEAFLAVRLIALQRTVRPNDRRRRA